MNRRTVIWACLAGFAVLAAIAYRGSGPGDGDPPSATKSSRRGGSDGRPAPVVTVAAAAETFPIRRKTIGNMESPAIVVVKSRIDSQVLEQHVSDGQMVKKGDLLFTLDDREIQAVIARDEATIAKDRAALAQAEAELERKQELIEKKVAPQQQVDQAMASFKAAQQTVEADEAVLQADRLRLGYAKLQAPIDGRIGAIRIAPGNLVAVNDATGLLTITQMQPLRAAFTLPERDLALLRAASARKPPAVVRVYAGEPEPLATGALDFVDSSVDIGSGTVIAKGIFSNDDFTLWPGQFVDVEIDLDVRPNTVMIPTVAIQTGQKGPYVFVAKPDQTAEMRQVALFGVEGNRTAITSGLEAGEKVIVDGQLRLSQGTRIVEAAPPGSQPGAKGSEAKGGKSRPVGTAENEPRQ